MKKLVAVLFAFQITLSLFCLRASELTNYAFMGVNSDTSIIVSTTDGYMDEEIVDTDNEESANSKGYSHLSLFFYELWYFCICICKLPLILLALLCGWLYRMKLMSGKRIKFLDYLGGLLVCTAFLTCFGDEGIDVMEWLPRLKSGFGEIVMLSAYIIILYLAWFCIIGLLKTGPNWMYYIVTFLGFLSLCIDIIIGTFLDKGGYGFWGLAAFLIIPCVAFIGFCLFVHFMCLKRCPKCHSAGPRYVQIVGTDDLGYSTEYSTEYKHGTEHDNNSDCDGYTETTRYITKKYNVEKLIHNYRHHLCCHRCGAEWSTDIAHDVDSVKNLDSIKKETHTTTYK